MLFAFNIMHYDYLTGFLAFLVWALPMACVSFGLALGVRNIGSELPAPVYALLSGLNSATVGIIALAAIQLSSKAVTDKLTRILVFFGGAAGMLYNALWYFPVLMAAGALTTVLWDLKVLQRLVKALRRSNRRDEQDVDAVELSNLEQAASAEAPASSVTARYTAKATSQATATLDTNPSNTLPSAESPTTAANPKTSWKAGTAVIATFLLSFIIVMALRGIYSDRNRGFDLFANLYLAGTIIFGGGPVVVPLLRSYIVSPGWVSPRDFLLGLAITQAFPGPNFNFAVYLGALAVQDTSLPPFAGAIIGFLAIYIPGLWLCAGFIGVWGSLRKVVWVRAALRGVHATAVGLVFTAVYRLFEIGYLDKDVQGGGTLSRDPWWVVIIAAACYGGMHFHLAPPVAIVMGAAMGLLRYAVVS
ncbi:hypothetical protein LTR15_004615 [Elasticomyces elasticus]|nr:hypothetical protein LTR15_004615 [Elasticomyces elasticus]